ncbi:MAG TPA: TIGR03067 domain-containing protein [Gemmataceae bacterium]|nr:TIGR03067 domain-containing protein [Gemmataceae bacterium]
MRCVTMCLAGLLLSGAGLVYSADDTKKDEATQNDLKALAGNWQVVSREVDGEKADQKAIEATRVTMDRDGIATVKREGKTIRKSKWTNLDTAKDPKTVDVEVIEGENKGKVYLGIYRVEENNMTFCLANPDKKRPTTFSTEAGSGCTLISFKREQAK